MRYAIYARYSSDLQSDHSIDDQVRLCRERGDQDGGKLVDTYADYAISGAHTAGRPSLSKLVEDASAGRFDCVIAEALDRLSRDQEDIAGIYKRLSFAGVDLVTLAEGKVDELHIGLKGTMNALFLKDLAAKTKRGQRGALAEKRIPGGMCYGYKLANTIDAAGKPVRGRRTIDSDQADVIRRIYREYAAGKSPRAIARALNVDGIPGPRGGQWRANAITGNQARLNGILHNPLYRGTIVYNRQSFIKDPVTGKRQARSNPPDQWVTEHVPDLRIVDPDLEKRVDSAVEAAARPHGQKARARRHLLSGLMKCASCGSSYTVCGSGRMRCSTRTEKGTCDNRVTVSIAECERRVLDALTRHLLDADAISDAVKEMHAQIARTRREAGRQRAGLERKAVKLQSSIDGIMRAIEDGLYRPEMKERMASLEAQRQEIANALAAIDEPSVIELNPNVAELYRRQVLNLNEAIYGESVDALEARQQIRTLIKEVRVHADRDQDGRAVLEVAGDLAAILALASGDKETVERCMVAVVAGAGLGQNHTSLEFIMSA